MKNLYPKGKGKIHPSPASPSASAGVAASGDALAVLLPAAILALTAALGNEDKEVLTYMITRSMNVSGMAAATGMGGAGGGGEERRRCRRVGAVHRPLLDCWCFDCYSSFWSRWNCSPARELIHQAIEAFEEHLASSESKGGGGGRGRRRERRAPDPSEKGKRSKEKEKERKKVEECTDEKILQEPALVRFTGEEKAAEAEATAGGGGDERREVEEVAAEEDGNETATAAAAESERRRGWPDVMGLFNPRLWNLWSPGV